MMMSSRKGTLHWAVPVLLVLTLAVAVTYAEVHGRKQHDDHHGKHHDDHHGKHHDDHHGKGHGKHDDDHHGKHHGKHDDDHHGKHDDDHHGKHHGKHDDDHHGRGHGKHDDDHHGKRHGGHYGRHDDDHHQVEHHGRHGDDHHGKHHEEHEHRRRRHHEKHEEDHHEEETHEEEEEEEEHDPEDDYEEIEDRLNRVTARLQHIEDELESRLDPELKSKALSLEHRVDLLEESDCDTKDHYDCGGDDNECVSRLFVCDGHNDCRNGDDEEHCDLPTAAGDVFEGHVVFDNCTRRRPETITFTITAVKTTEVYTSLPFVRAVIEIETETDEEELHVSLPTVGYYRFSSQNLVLLPPEDDGLALVCDFDGHDLDKCVGDIKRVTTLETCAQFVFFRQSEDDEEGEDDDAHESPEDA
jgi:hypothetical protein